MCQHVRGRRAGSSHRGDRETGVSLRVSGCGSPQLRDDVIVVFVVDFDGTSPATSFAVPPRWFDHGEHDNDDQHHNDDKHVKKQQRRRGRGCIRGSQLSGQEESFSENPREIGEPRWYPGGWYNRMADLRVLPGSIDDGRKRHICGSTVGIKEAGPPESLQSGSGGGCNAEPTSRNGTPSCWLQNRFYPTTRPQGGWQTAYCRQDAFLSRTFPSSVQIGVYLYDKT